MHFCANYEREYVDFLRNLYRWQKIYTAASSDKSHLWLLLVIICDLITTLVLSLKICRLYRWEGKLRETANRLLEGTRLLIRLLCDLSCVQVIDKRQVQLMIGRANQLQGR